MNDMKRKSPREFWNMFRETKRTIGEYVSVEDVVEHFKNLASHHSETNREVHDEKVRPGEANTRFEELDSHIYEDEIRKASKHLNRNKAPGIDNVINESSIENMDILIEPVCKLFNDIFETGVFPTMWSKGISIPILKKRPDDVPNKCRGMTLLREVIYTCYK